MAGSKRGDIYGFGGIALGVHLQSGLFGSLARCTMGKRAFKAADGIPALCCMYHVKICRYAFTIQFYYM